MNVAAWSPYQLGIFDFIRVNTSDEVAMAIYGGRVNAIVKAVAGSGKSTTLVAAMQCVPQYTNGQRTTSVFLAFNKAIAEELKGRGVNAKTFHGLVFSQVMKSRNQRDVAKTKLRDVLDAHTFNEEDEFNPTPESANKLDANEARMYQSFLIRLVGLGRNAGIGCLEDDTPEAWTKLIELHDLEFDNEACNIRRAVQLASQLLQWSYESSLVDFDDMLYLAVRDGIQLPKFDYVFVDEAQDTNAIQRAVLRKIMKPTTRLIAVGDPAQAIYGFRGADGNSLKLIADEFECIELPLTVSYRCPLSVVAYARRWVEHIEAAPNAPAGVVQNLGLSWKPEIFQSGDLIVCRTTKPLVSLAYKLIKSRIPAAIMGKEIGANLVALVGKLNGGTIDRLKEKLYAWSTREIERATARKQDSKIETIIDKRDALIVLMESLSEDDRTINGLVRTIEGLFSDRAAAVTLATIHKSKGLEAPRVFWLNASQCPAAWAKQEWQQAQEKNLCYVAATRAKQELYLIEEVREIDVTLDHGVQPRGKDAPA